MHSSIVRTMFDCCSRTAYGLKKSKSYVLTTIHILLDLNNVSINRLCAFDILRCGPFPLEFRLVNKWKGRSRSGTTYYYFHIFFFIEVELRFSRLEFVSCG